MMSVVASDSRVKPVPQLRDSVPERDRVKLDQQRDVILLRQSQLFFQSDLMGLQRPLKEVKQDTLAHSHILAT